MIKQKESIKATENHPLSQYYRFQSRIYDLTRWSFLFGRQLVINKIPVDRDAAVSILEVGCGTGRNLTQLAKRFPNARITGVDLSKDMLDIARRKAQDYNGRINIVHGAFGDVELEGQFDVIVFSYCLTMVNPGWDKLIAIAAKTLAPNGVIAVADFHDGLAAFRKHMSNHHVRMKSHILPVLESTFKNESYNAVKNAYGGVWQWFCFVGSK